MPQYLLSYLATVVSAGVEVVSAGVEVVSDWSDNDCLAVSVFTVSVWVVSAGEALTIVEDSLANTLLTETMNMAARAT